MEFLTVGQYVAFHFTVVGLNPSKTTIYLYTFWLVYCLVVDYSRHPKFIGPGPIAMKYQSSV